MSLGVGMYQHDLSASKLESRLDEVVTRIVSEVGVNVNTASRELLRRVAGLNRRVASSIYDRARVKPFQTRQSLLQVKGLGKKMYSQCAGFLRIPNGTCAYDNTNIHPESYDIAELLSSSLSVREVAKRTNRSVEDIEIVKRFLESPGHLMDPRNKIAIPKARTGPLCMKDLKPGTVLSGVVSNRMPYGLFVDIGVETDALLHFGKLSSNHRVRQLGVSSTLHVKVESVDIRRERISIAAVSSSTPTSLSSNDSSSSKRTVSTTTSTNSNRQKQHHHNNIQYSRANNHKRKRDYRNQKSMHKKKKYRKRDPS